MSIVYKIALDDIFPHSNIPDDTYLREDMYQATYEVYGIDCGWYEIDGIGQFVTYLIKDYDWDAPVIRIAVKTLDDAKWSINICKDYLQNTLYP